MTYQSTVGSSNSDVEDTFDTTMNSSIPATQTENKLNDLTISAVMGLASISKDCHCLSQLDGEGDNSSQAAFSKPTISAERSNSEKTSVNNRIDSNDSAMMTFPEKLMYIVSNEQYSDIIDWLPHGNGFMIFQKKRFEAEILPLYFGQVKYKSFTRKMNRWMFHRVPRGQELGAYYHKYFKRDTPSLCRKMSCLKESKSRSRMCFTVTANNAWEKMAPMTISNSSHLVRETITTFSSKDVSMPKQSLTFKPMPNEASQNSLLPSKLPHRNIPHIDTMLHGYGYPKSHKTLSSNFTKSFYDDYTSAAVGAAIRVLQRSNNDLLQLARNPPALKISLTSALYSAGLHHKPPTTAFLA